MEPLQGVRKRKTFALLTHVKTGESAATVGEPTTASVQTHLGRETVRRMRNQCGICEMRIATWLAKRTISWHLVLLITSFAITSCKYQWYLFQVFIPQLRPIQFPWYTSLSVKTVKPTGTLASIKLSNNETIKLTLDNGVIHYFYEEQSIPVSLPRIHDGHWHNIEAKWMTAEIWFSLDYGQFEATAPFEVKVQNLHVSQVVVGHPSSSVTACVKVKPKKNSIAPWKRVCTITPLNNPDYYSLLKDVRVGSAKNFLRKSTTEKNVNEGCSLATACVGAACPPRSTCVEEGGRHKCQCDPGYTGVHCVPICDLKPCKNNGSCVLDLTTPRGYHCKCDERYYRGKNCEQVMELSCPTTWWGWPVCGPCSCPADKNYSPECNKTNGQCKCKVFQAICKIVSTLL